jgi:mono/diheme cytochrome c family protein
MRDQYPSRRELVDGPGVARGVRWPDSAQLVRQICILGILFVAWAFLFAFYMSAQGRGTAPSSSVARAGTARAVQPTTSAASRAVNPSANGPAVSATAEGQAPAAQGPGGQSSTVSFARDVLPIFQQRCVQCHGARRQAGGVALSTYDDVLQAVIPGDPNGTDLVALIQSGRMPRNSPPLLAAEVQTIISWIEAGAQNN